MYLSGKGAPFGDKKLLAPKPTLNPNATEFVPFALRSPVAGANGAEASRRFATPASSAPGKGILDMSSVSNDSDDEAQQYWRNQLPDDITPDFKVMGVDDAEGVHNLSFSSLSLADTNEGSRYSASIGGGFMLKEQQGLSPRPANGNSHAELLRLPVSSYGEYLYPTGFHSSLAKPWDQQIVGSNQLLAREGTDVGNSRHGLLADMSNEQLLDDNADMSPLEFLASQFPGFAAESLAEVYFANAGDLNVTIDTLTQRELQVDKGLNILTSKTVSAPNLDSMNLPALSARDGDLAKFTADGFHQNGSPYVSPEKQGSLLLRSNSFVPSRGALDFASAVRKMAPQDFSMWKYESNGSSDTSTRSSRSSQALASSYGNRLQSRGSARSTPMWLETGEAVANMYSEMREEAREHARARNVYLEQARQAYFMGNKALAMELSIRGQLHKMQMKTGHDKAQETVFPQRNSGIQTNGREKMIDLHGLHVSEAIHVLKRELAVMKNAARCMEQRLVVYICLGPRAPARLPAAVRRYLLEEGLDYSELQPGLLGVVVY